MRFSVFVMKTYSGTGKRDFNLGLCFCFFRFLFTAAGAYQRPDSVSLCSQVLSTNSQTLSRPYFYVSAVAHLKVPDILYPVFAHLKVLDILYPAHLKIPDVHVSCKYRNSRSCFLEHVVQHLQIWSMSRIPCICHIFYTS